ncbi:MAG TPA: adenosine deaminase [Petrimonas sp.]|uniref:adenosine deaminase n=1 Tax=Petrimonas sp. TaxID=2023866 RepID=UPI00095D4891|nr:adenosine deaminase [Petrimonas sp.]OJV36543.1 MAG: adenosine deaminase [Bacteroidia bacterium 43-41]MEA4949575.1 adenosine deaminase [Petrimonas sp.]MEA4980111.1 adenosine deaminase [Petrimonas sp.]MEA5043290.1 adenosine deaminase [Petrimonas sp.]
MDENLKRYIELIPKAELHVHVEGTFEPERIFEIAQRNNVPLKYNSVEDLRKAYKFNNLQDFLDIYYGAAKVLLHEQDFYDLTMDYLRKAHANNVVHTEVFFDPQTHTTRGVSFVTVINGITRAMDDAKTEVGVSSKLIMCFLRHLSEKSAMETLESALLHKDKIIAIGLDSSENGHPPSKFFNVFNRVREEGFFVVAHAGEEGPAEYIWEAIDLLEAVRIDHGVSSVDDPGLIEELRDREIPLTVCPLSNLKLKVVENLENIPVKMFLEKGIRVTLNSDDPSYFGGYVNNNYLQTAEALNLSRNDIYTLAKNSFLASFITEKERDVFLEKLLDFENSFI